MKKSVIHNLIKTLLFVGIFLFLFWKYSYIIMNKTENTYAATLNYEKKDSIDVIFLGSSQIIYGIQPMQLWKDYGIASYNLATSGTGIPMSYWAAEIAIEEQHPKFIVLDVAFVFKDDKVFDGALARLHPLMDSFPANESRYHAIQDLVEEEDRMQFYVPTYIYHTRWNDGLEEKDFKPMDDHGAKGALLTDGAHDFTNIVAHADYMPKEDLAPTARQYLEELIELCKENDVTLIFMVIPTAHTTGMQGMYQTVNDIAEENGLQFINGYDDPEFWQLDYATDFMDTAHVNLRGSEKVTRYVGNYLMENYDVPTHTGELSYASWDEAYEEYCQFKESIHEYPTYEFGDVINFGIEGNGVDYFVSGMECVADGNSYSWSVNKRSDALFYLSDAEEIGDMKLKCNVAYVYPNFSTNTRSMGVYYNDNLIGQVKLDSTMHDIELEFDIPGKLITPGELQHLCFTYSGIEEVPYISRAVSFNSLEFIK